jgi:hypothetical protein
MKIEDIIKTTAILNNSNRIILNVIYRKRNQWEIQWSFETVWIIWEQYNVLRILRGQKGNPANMCHSGTHDCQNE